jgi:hypothetical protein
MYQTVNYVEGAQMLFSGKAFADRPQLRGAGKGQIRAAACYAKAIS